MKNLLLILTSILSLILTYSKTYGDYHMEPDKKLHLEAGIIIGGASYFIGPAAEEIVFDKSRIHPCIWSISMAGLAGAGKEIVYDDMMGKGYPEKRDFYYTLAGGVFSGVTLTIIEYLFNIRDNSLHLEANLINKNILASYLCKF